MEIERASLEMERVQREKKLRLKGDGEEKVGPERIDGVNRGRGERERDGIGVSTKGRSGAAIQWISSLSLREIERGSGVEAVGTPRIMPRRGSLRMD